MCECKFKFESGIYLHVRVKHHMAWHRGGPYTPLLDESEEPAGPTVLSTPTSSSASTVTGTDSGVAGGGMTSAGTFGGDTVIDNTTLEEMLDAISESASLRKRSCHVASHRVLCWARSCLFCILLTSVGLVKRHGFCPHLYADDTQIYSSCTPSAVTDFQVCLSACIDDVAAWMLANRLQLNTGKTNLLWCATARRRHQLPTSALRIGSDFVSSSTSVRNLRIYLDADLSMPCHSATDT